MHRSIVALSALALLATTAAAQLPKSATRQLDSLLDSPPFNRNLWGIALVDDGGKLLFGRNADKLFIPASNTKLVVTTVASALLSPDWRVRTSVYSAAPIVDGMVQGDLILYGRGDPTMGRRCYATDTTITGACDHDSFIPLGRLVSALKARGVRVIQGDVVGDGSWFDAELIHPDWGSYDLNWWYAAPVSGLGFNDNSVDITWRPGNTEDAPATLTLDPDLGDVSLENRTRTVGADGESDIGDRMYREPGTLHLWAEGTVALGGRGGLESFALPDPSLFTARAFRRVLADSGISVLGTTLSTVDSTKYFAARQTAPLAETESRPLSDWIFPILNTSQNWYADMLVKQLGRQFGTRGSWAEGIAVERRFLVDSAGIDSTLFAVSDGSGLSAANLVAPLAFTGMVRYIRRHPNFSRNFAPGLPESGKAGSLKSRFLDTPIEGRVYAKTGSISRVNTLTGYFELADGRSYTFSVMANHHTQGGRRMLAEIDSVVVAMAAAVGKQKPKR